jgi:hypothetical protein
MGNLHDPKVKIIQPVGINYMIQKWHYTREYAQEYIDMLISKSEDYISKKRRGLHVAPLMTVEQLETQLVNIKNFKIEVES